MAQSVAVTSAYAGEVVETIFQLTTVGNQAVEKGSVYVQAGVQDKLYLPRLITGVDPLQARVATPQSSDASESFVYNERFIEPLDAMFYDEFNPRHFEDAWKPFQPTGNLVDRVDNPLIQASLMDAAVRSVGTQLGKLIWQGDTTSGTPALVFFDGFIKILAASGAIAPTPAGAITAANVISILEACDQAVPDALYDDPAMIYHMSTADYRLYQEAARALDFKGPNITEAGESKYGGRTIRHYSGMEKDHIIVAKATASTDSNLWAAVDVIDDAEYPKIARLQANSELFFIKILLKYGVNSPLPTECVLYSPA